MIQIVDPAKSYEALEELTGHAEKILQVTLQRTATRCNTLQHTATHCSALQRTAVHCNTL